MYKRCPAAWLSCVMQFTSQTKFSGNKCKSKVNDCFQKSDRNLFFRKDYSNSHFLKGEQVFVNLVFDFRDAKMLFARSRHAPLWQFIWIASDTGDVSLHRITAGSILYCSSCRWRASAETISGENILLWKAITRFSAGLESAALGGLGLKFSK